MNRLHRKYGPVVQTARAGVSVNSASAIGDLYAVSRRLDRPYPLVIFHNYQTENLVSTEDGGVHRERRKSIRSIYSASRIESGDLQKAFEVCVRRFVEHIEGFRDPVEVRPALRLLLYETMSHMIYGRDHALDLFSDSQQRSAIEADIEFQEGRFYGPMVFVVAWFPRFTQWLRSNHIAPKDIRGEFPAELLTDRLGREALASLKAIKSTPTSPPLRAETLMGRLHSHYVTNGPSPAVPSELYILSECVDHFWAGVNTTVDGLVPLVHHLSRPENKFRQERLRRELRKADVSAGSPLPPPTELKKLPYLDAVIRETLRLNPPIPVSLGRKASKRDGPIMVCGHVIPQGMEMGASPYIIGRNPDVYERPDDWIPERWVDSDAANSDELNRDKLKDMKRHFFAFGSGPRMCIGVNVAWTLMRGAISGLYSNFETELVDGEKKAGWLSRGSEEKVRFRRLGGE